MPTLNMYFALCRLLGTIPTDITVLTVVPLQFLCCEIQFLNCVAWFASEIT